MEDEVPIGSFGKLILTSKKNQNRLDKHCCYKTVTQKDTAIRKAFSPISKKARRQVKYYLPEPWNSVQSTEYFEGGNYCEVLQQRVIYHRVGRVTFLHKSYIEIRQFRQHKDSFDWPKVYYSYQPRPYLPFEVAPAVNVSDLVQFQRANLREVKRSRRENIFTYLLHTHQKEQLDPDFIAWLAQSYPESEVPDSPNSPRAFLSTYLAQYTIEEYADEAVRRANDVARRESEIVQDTQDNEFAFKWMESAEV